MRTPRTLIAGLACMVALTIQAFRAHAQATPPGLVPPTETYAGKTHSQWVESWLKWVFSVPGTAKDFPFLDTTGASSGLNQSGPVFFLSKTWLGKKGNPPEQRSATVPEGSALFVPFDGIFSVDPNRDPATVAASNRSDLQGWEPFVFRLVVDGQEIPIDSSLTSPFLHETPVLSLPLPANAAARSPEVGFGSLPTTVYPFHSLEWAALLKPLSVGQHTVHVYGSDSVGSNHEWVTDVVWTINVTPASTTFPPVISRNPADARLSMGDRAVFSVSASGTLPLTYQWQKNGNALPNQTTRTLTLSKVTADDAGNYSVVVTGPDGRRATSTAAALTVDTLFTLMADSPVATGMSYTGAAWGDYDNDGFIDLVLAGATQMLLYHNEAGTGLKRVGGTNVLATTTHAQQDTSSGFWGDYDNDGNLDLVVPMGWNQQSTSPSRLFRGIGGGNFVRAQAEFTTPRNGRSLAAHWADFNRDGFLDLFLDTTGETNASIYLGKPGGEFTPLRPAGFEAARKGYGRLQGSVVGDFNADGLPDLGLSGTFSSLEVLINQAGTDFSAGEPILRAHRSVGGASEADFDNDGDLDVLVIKTPNSASGEIGEVALMKNDGAGGFQAAQLPAGLTPEAYTSSWGDYDNDGYLDLFTHDGLWHNQGDGGFVRVEGGSLASATVRTFASGSWGDYDNDGFLDLVVADETVNDRLFHNNGNGNGWLLLKLVGTKSNRSAIGAKIRLRANLNGKSVLQYREIGTGNAHAQNDLRAHFGLADAAQAESIEIEWPSGTKQTLSNVAGKQLLTVIEPDGAARLTITAGLLLQLEGVPGTRYEVESSTSLTDWTPRPELSVTTDHTGKAAVSLTGGEGNAPAALFFRARTP